MKKTFWTIVGLMVLLTIGEIGLYQKNQLQNNVTVSVQDKACRVTPADRPILDKAMILHGSNLINK
ncbi:hypothetical protein [Agrilactobacillus composti]|uniref:hypothetical protein n=1 Tax=Agrilactobacillus composti TaxID=398555 RepID=UPI00054EBB75|nr:hypothetical protein [Agrilactobacillus composti]